MMALSTAYAPERSKIEQIVLEFFAKSLHIILESRIPGLCGEDESLVSSASSSSSGSKTRDRWFNLALGDCTAALENFEPWRRSFSDPMVVDILLEPAEIMPGTPSDHPCRKGSSHQKGIAIGSSTGERTVLERWTVQFEPRIGSSASKEAHSSKGLDMKRVNITGIGDPRILNKETSDVSCRVSTNVVEVPAVYKKTVILLRSVYCRSRLLPAYRLFRLANTPSNCCSFNLSYSVLSSASAFSDHEKRDMRLYNFSSVETGYGKMRLSVAYRHTTAVTALEVVPSILPRIIPDYVGSPTTDPLKRFSGEPHSLPSSGISSGRGMRMVSVPTSVQSSPPGPFLGRRHSWSGRVDQMQPPLQPPASPSSRVSRSPSPSFPFYTNTSPPYPPLPNSPHSQKNPLSDSLSPLSSPLSSTDRFSSGQPMTLYKPAGASQPILIALEKNRFSPPYSPSPSPSPPTSYPGSAPVSIPKASSRAMKYFTGDSQQRSRNLLPPLSPSTRKTGALLRSSSESPRYSGKVPSHVQQSRSFDLPYILNAADYGRPQVWKNEGGGLPFSMEVLYRGQSQATLSRSSSRLGLGEDVEDEDFSCPFAVDDVDMEEKYSRSDSSGPKGEVPESSSSSLQGTQQRLQDAAVGALVRVFKSAAPLREQFHAAYETPDQVLEAEKRESSSGNPAFFPPRALLSESAYRAKTAADALEELERYKNIRNIVLKHVPDGKHGPDKTGS